MRPSTVFGLGVAAALLGYAATAPAETLQNDNGVCTKALGCTDPDGTSGNPNDLVECFSSATLTPPFDLTEATYIMDDVPSPDSLNLKVYEWTGSGPPGTLIATIPLSSADTASGAHTIHLAPAVTIDTQDFCVGVNGTPTDDGFRIFHSTTVTVAGSSFLRAPKCGYSSFTSLDSVGYPGNWCITATIREPTAAPALGPLGLLLAVAGLLGLGGRRLLRQG